jgi:hypothetical protein
MSDEPRTAAVGSAEATLRHVRALESRNTALREALGDLVEEMAHLVNHGGVGIHQAVFDRARKVLEDR